MRQLTYLDFSGRPRLRRFVVAAGALLAFIAGLALWYFFSDPHTLAKPSDASSNPELKIEHSAAERVNPSATSETPAPVCPDNAKTWDFVEVFPGDHYQRIEPGCVYQGVRRTAAWMLLERMGYGKPEAAQLVNLAEPPWSPAEFSTAYTNFQGPVEIPLIMEWPAHPDFLFWQVDREGRPATVISLRGCFPVHETAMCVLALDRLPGTAVSVLGEHQVAHHSADQPGARSFHLLEYRGEGIWDLIGQFADQVIFLEGQFDATEEREVVAARLGVEVWDAAWLKGTFNLQMKPLPADWRLFSPDPEVMKAISTELNRYIFEPEGGSDGQ